MTNEQEKDDDTNALLLLEHMRGRAQRQMRAVIHHVDYVCICNCARECKNEDSNHTSRIVFGIAMTKRGNVHNINECTAACPKHNTA